MNFNRFIPLCENLAFIYLLLICFMFFDIHLWYCLMGPNFKYRPKQMKPKWNSISNCCSKYLIINIMTKTYRITYLYPGYQIWISIGLYHYVIIWLSFICYCYVLCFFDIHYKIYYFDKNKILYSIFYATNIIYHWYTFYVALFLYYNFWIIITYTFSVMSGKWSKL